MLLVAKPKQNRPKRPVSYRLPEDLLDLLDQLAADNRRTTTAELELAIEHHLKRNKRWPIEEDADGE